jgi:hypothetical protein
MWQRVVLVPQPTKFTEMLYGKRNEKGMMIVKTKRVVCLDEREYGRRNKI